MATIALTRASFEETRTAASSCWSTGGRRGVGRVPVLAPVFEAAAMEHDDIVFAKVDTEAEQGLATGRDHVDPHAHGLP